MNGIKYSVIIPMYNEEEVILESYRRLDNVMRPLGEEYELIFVNDGQPGPDHGDNAGCSEKGSAC